MTEQSIIPALARSGLTPAAPRKRRPGPTAVRRRYRMVQWTLAAIGGLVAATVAETALAAITARGLAPDLTSYALALALLSVGIGAPWLLVGVLWRWKRRRNGWGS